MFVLDMSGSVGLRNFRIMLETVQSIVSRFYIGKYSTRVGVDVFSTNAKTVIKLKDNNYLESLHRAIAGIKYEGGWTNTYKALNNMRQTSFSNNYGKHFIL